MGFTKQRKLELAKKGMKQCPRCADPKLKCEFGKDCSRKDGLDYLCKEHKKEVYENNKEEILKKAKTRNAKPENKIEKAKYDKQYRDTHKEEIAKQHKEYRNKPSSKIKIAKTNKEYVRYKRKTDPNFKILGNLRNRIYIVLKNNSKFLSTMFLIGCDIDYLMYHLQEKFTNGMSWDNYGDWHIDHIKPCSKFDLSKKSEQLKCFNYTNLQPLWAIDNREKSDKYRG